MTSALEIRGGRPTNGQRLPPASGIESRTLEEMMIAQRYGGRTLENFLLLGLAVLIATALRIAG